MQEKIVALKEVSVQLAGKPVLTGINLSIYQNEQWAIIGASGSGKTTLANALCGKLFFRGDISFYLPPSSQVVLVEQQHRFKNRSNMGEFYYQQRFNATESEDAATAGEVLGNYSHAPLHQQEWLQTLHLEAILDKPLIQLSNGENKRLQLAKALLENPALLILDNPFIGLDVDGRKTLSAIIDTLATAGIHLILITTAQDLPASITHVAVLDNGRLVSGSRKEDYKPVTASIQFDTVFDKNILQQLHQQEAMSFSNAVSMKHVTILYGNKTILDDINWEVKRGERWSLSGPNGAGKSTLLSLITADNPQAYANNICLFDRKRGSGESIWDIKRHIGFVSPELHLYFDQTATCFEVIASGLFDTIGLFRRLSEEQEEQVKGWMQLLKMEALSGSTLRQVAAGRQRMVLLARALIKNPPLLILDEPCQGLDEEQAAYFKHLINLVCETFNTTLIYVSHYNKDIPECINKFLRLEDGRIASIPSSL